ncbi:hypothetical protein [Bradyrhizobium lablabi]|uniref:hypothetical protein n=1 Tax=Bradyrhizobium lablabi TaxID=722472 RepID=UPI001BA61CDB|nr:hypothetical protein [Bradyrhizobium lablabi]MBR0695092.1 hypothetical protein [Bradyrhizobium lablabi]
MRRVIAVAVAGLSLGGCSSSSLSSFSLDSLKPAPQPVQVQLESTPPGADAVTSLGPGCKTPCSVSVPAPESSFSVTFNMPKFQQATVPVTVTRTPGDFTTAATSAIDPNPVVAELKPAGPPPRKPHAKRKPKPAAEAPAEGAAFPDQNAAAPTQ